MNNHLVVANLSKKEIKRIFKNVSPKVNKCWIWTGATDARGYGLVHFRGRTERIHRIMYAWRIKEIPRRINGKKSLQLHHLCNNPGCCNPSHLQLMSPRSHVLSSNGITAMHHRKTKCIHGHELKLAKNGKRRDCPTCDLIRHKKRMNGPHREYWLEKARQAAKRWRDKHK